jgi:F-type H+-transporting ATPase subunit epsilon
MAIKIDVVTAEKMVFTDQVDEILVPGAEGELGILPHHTPLMTMLKPGELLLKKGKDEISLAVAGGFIEIRPDHVIVLADAAERAEEIDATRAEAARKRAQDALSRVKSAEEKAATEAALARAIARLSIADKMRRRKGAR